jgi:hypothetical protein
VGAPVRVDRSSRKPLPVFSAREGAARHWRKVSKGSVSRTSARSLRRQSSVGGSEPPPRHALGTDRRHSCQRKAWTAKGGFYAMTRREWRDGMKGPSEMIAVAIASVKRPLVAQSGPCGRPACCPKQTRVTQTIRLRLRLCRSCPGARKLMVPLCRLAVIRLESLCPLDHVETDYIARVRAGWSGLVCCI